VTQQDPRAIARTGLFQRYRTDRVAAWIEVTGTSMEPLIQPGNRLLVTFGERPERTGQVILCSIDGAFVAHRLVSHRLIPAGSGVPSVRLIAKGDAEAYPDRSIAAEDVYGVVHAVRRADGRLVTAGLDDTPGAIVALASWWGGSAAWLGRRMIRHAPAATAPPLLSTLLILSRLPIRVITALMPWLVPETRAEGR
jgi:peptidase S24-like protein